LIASGGVNQQTAYNFIMAGAAGLGIGGELIPSESVQQRDEGRIRELARRFRSIVHDARARKAEPLATPTSRASHSRQAVR
jgi:2-dehydro-3-deoxyphosphogluconate aldolase / (4S)-4-hydroxy-2-oxoglutarate aldolase